MKSVITLLSFFLVFVPVLAFPHEGHGHVSDGIGHYLFSIGHMAPFICLAIMGLVLLYLKRAEQRRDA